MTSIAQISENEQMEITGTLKKSFGKNTVYRFLNSVKTNWERLTCMLSARIINGSIRKLTGEDRQDVFIIDDTLFKRTGGIFLIICFSERILLITEMLSPWETVIK